MAIKLYRPQDRIPIRIGDAVFHFAPLTVEQKKTVLSEQIAQSGEVRESMAKTSFLMVKYMIRKVEGIEYAITGEPFECRFEDDEQSALTDECVNELMCLEMSPRMTSICYDFLNGVPTELRDARTKKAMKDVEILPAYEAGKKK